MKSFIHKLKCHFWNWYVHFYSDWELAHKDEDIYHNWLNINRKKDKSLSAQDFKLYFYLSKLRK